MATNNRNEKEIFVGNNRFYLGEDNVLYITVEGEFNEKLATGIEDAYLKLMKKSGRKTNLLIDSTEMGQPSSVARKIIKRMTEHKFTGKVSVYGTNRVSRMLAAFIIGLSNNKNMHFSKSKEEAINWLKQHN